MAHGEAEHGCTQGESCRPGHHEHANGGKHHRRPAGPSFPAEPTVGRAEDEPSVPRPRGAEPPAAEPEPAAAGCRNELAGWAGAHRHGPVRPRQRGNRRERPPRRWC
ncbi:hypothetical protein [Micromonospora mirobrigensis]|uniref:Uncharacterized protein n=1 Tax=Micromonospora mirobrigensis TaxID=262898 RepID=A0A1C5AG95_9ACTN|nr:hypothetical protein [Micromonospora mirobrigensis]SCF44189.1 hypothetical protein GA0070564_11041 [Micromonospora mirobrigensis]